MNPFENLQPANNVGNAFMQAFQQGQQNRQQTETRNALSKYAQNPDDPEVFSEIARLNPELAIQLRGQQQQQHAQALEQHRDNIIKGAQIFRQLGVKDEATYQQALAMGRQIGIDLSEVPPNFDPQYVNGVVALADTFAPHNGEQLPSAVREYEYRQHLPADQQAGFDRFRQSIRPQIFGSAESGYNVFDPNAQPPTAQNMPTVQNPQEAMSLPPGTQFRLPDGRIGTVPGGAGGNASGGFRTGPQ